MGDSDLAAAARVALEGRDRRGDLFFPIFLLVPEREPDLAPDLALGGVRWVGDMAVTFDWTLGEKLEGFEHGSTGARGTGHLFAEWKLKRK